MYADRKAFLLDKVEAHIILNRDNAANTTAIERKITLTGALNDEQRARLQEIANSCPVHKILSNQINITTSLA
jgi:putative redox protein